LQQAAAKPTENPAVSAGLYLFRWDELQENRCNLGAILGVAPFHFGCRPEPK
jgi:hypothetical protein